MKTMFLCLVDIQFAMTNYLVCQIVKIFEAVASDYQTVKFMLPDSTGQCANKCDALRRVHVQKIVTVKMRICAIEWGPTL